MVETHPQCKRQSRTPSSAGYDHHNGRLQERLGRSASILSDQWQMVPERVPPTHQLSRAKGVLSGLENLSERQVSRNRIPATRQHDRHCLHQQQRGYTFPQLMTLALETWDWCQERDILVIASHIPGGDNVSADRGSREFTDMNEWKLDPIIIQPFRLNCQTDLSASRLTSQLADYISYAFTINWATLRGYASPPSI